MPPPQGKPALSHQQQKLIDDLAKANGVTSQQAMNALLVQGARAFAASTDVAFTHGQAREMELHAHEAAHIVQQRGGVQQDPMTKLLKR
jgi:hypothetical protein